MADLAEDLEECLPPRDAPLMDERRLLRVVLSGPSWVFVVSRGRHPMLDTVWDGDHVSPSLAFWRDAAALVHTMAVCMMVCSSSLQSDSPGHVT